MATRGKGELLLLIVLCLIIITWLISMLICIIEVSHCYLFFRTSVFHVHMHLIPRYKGDVKNPKDGVRGVILVDYQ